MTAVVYVDKNEFLRNMVEMAIKKEFGTVYTIDTLENQIEIIKDLDPQVIVVDLKTCENDLNALFDNFTCPIKAIGSEFDRYIYVANKDHFKEFIPKPLSPVGLLKGFLK